MAGRGEISRTKPKLWNFGTVLIFSLAFLAFFVFYTPQLFGGRTYAQQHFHHILTNTNRLPPFSSDCTAHSHHPFFQQHSHYEGLEEEMARKQATLGPMQCPVCGQSNLTFDSWGDNVRDTGLCPVCRASNRHRQLAIAISLYTTEVLGQLIDSVADLQHSTLHIYNAECNGAMHMMMSKAPHYVCSEFLGPDKEPGVVENGVRHENLMKTSFPSESFDMIVSSEVFEHMPGPYVGQKEMLRILKPRGAHIFTVPYISQIYKDLVKATEAPNGTTIFHGEPMYHLDPIRPEGILVYTLFGQEMVDKLCQMGYWMKVLHLRIPLMGIIGGYNYLFIAIKAG